MYTYALFQHIVAKKYYFVHLLNKTQMTRIHNEPSNLHFIELTCKVIQTHNSSYQKLLIIL